MIARELTAVISKFLNKGKVLILLGARQTGKTTLLKELSSNYESALWLNADEYDIQQIFEKPTSTQIKSILGASKFVVIDEAQRIPNIGIALKLIHENYPDVKLVATGSSAFDLQNKTYESLTGRKIECQLFPLSFQELKNHHGILEEKRLLHNRLIYGSYPEVVSYADDQRLILKQLADSYLFKDVLMIDSLKKPEKLVKLLQALALQIGSEVSYNELGKLVGLDSKTVETYISLLEKTFIVFRLQSFARNARNELKLSKKIYFYDNGIRNAVINNFQLAVNRADIGALFENYFIAERKKYNAYQNNFVSPYFWRTKEQQEIDYIEEADGLITAFEIKWNSNKKVRFPKNFTSSYPNHELVVVTPENYDTYLSN
ncbi:ATP-binding protein [Flavobacterium sp.]|uniref:ATP-binding protein n=1 Tax=Flavobacterium sp. TaxID=239 RepID=UPI003B9A6FEF